MIDSHSSVNLIFVIRSISGPTRGDGAPEQGSVGRFGDGLIWLELRSSASAIVVSSSRSLHPRGEYEAETATIGSIGGEEYFFSSHIYSAI